jgi:hypothetical protein
MNEEGHTVVSKYEVTPNLVLTFSIRNTKKQEI